MDLSIKLNEEDIDDDVDVSHTEDPVDEETAVEFVRSTLAEEWDHLPDSAFLLQCLIVKKFNLAKSIEIAKKFIKFRMKWAWPYRIPVSHVKQALFCNVHQVVPVPDQLGRRIILFRPELIGTADSVLECHKMAVFLMEWVTKDRNTMENGIALIVDLSGSSLWTTYRTFTVSDYERGLSMWFCFPCKVKRIYILNSNSSTRIIANLVLSFLPQKIKERVSFEVPGSSTLVQEMGGRAIPKEYGGDLEFNWSDIVTRIISCDEDVSQLE